LPQSGEIKQKRKKQTQPETRQHPVIANKFNKLRHFLFQPPTNFSGNVIT
jgi:hypothetical protein